MVCGPFRALLSQVPGVLLRVLAPALTRSTNLHTPALAVPLVLCLGETSFPDRLGSSEVDAFPPLQVSCKHVRRMGV